MDETSHHARQSSIALKTRRWTLGFGLFAHCELLMDSCLRLADEAVVGAGPGLGAGLPSDW